MKHIRHLRLLLNLIGLIIIITNSNCQSNFKLEVRTGIFINDLIDHELNQSEYFFAYGVDSGIMANLSIN